MVFGLKNKLVHHVLTFFVWFVEYNELIHHLILYN
jgi:hypothetical protein